MQSEDFLNLFTLNSLTPRNVQPHQQAVGAHPTTSTPQQQTVTPHQSPNQQNRAQGDNTHNADIIKRINILLGESLDLNNMNFSLPIYTHTDTNMNSLSSQNSFTGNDLITNYPTLAGLNTGASSARSLDFTQNGSDIASGGRPQDHRNTPIKPVRAIRGDQYYNSSTPADDRMKSDRGSLCTVSNRVPMARTSLFEDPAAHYNLQQVDRSGLMPMGMPPKNRSPFTDSDTSGISSDTSAISESYLLDLMNSLTITPPSTGNVGINNDFFRHQNLLPNNNNWANGDVGGAFRFSDSGTTIVSPKLLSKPKIADVGHLFMTDCSDPNSIERAARLYRSAASICEATCTWSGQLPLRINQREPIYSCKVFLGGIPWDITEAGLERCFKPFGRVRVEWPGKDGKHPRFGSKDIRGYAYLLFENDKCVRALLDNCSRDVLGGEYYYKVPSKRLPGKKVQVIPWILSDSNYVCQLTDRLDTNKTVFVGALHGMINAEALATIMNDLFGDVIYAGIDLDKHKYPIGSGRVTFSTMRSYMKAVCAAFVEVKTLKFTKTIQIDPYLEEDTLCQHCNYQKGRFFCRDQQCFRYYCQACWQWQHTSDLLSHHKPLTRYKKNNGKDQQNIQ